MACVVIRAQIVLMLAVALAACGGGGSGSSGQTPAPPPPAPPPPPPPDPGSPPAATDADGIWHARGDGVPWGGAVFYMHDGMVIATGGRIPTSRVAYGVYQISGNDLTAQLTRMREGFPLSGFTGTIGTKDDDTKYIDASLATVDGTVEVEFEYQSDEEISQDSITGTWQLPPGFDDQSMTMTVDADGAFFVQRSDGCAGNGTIQVPRPEVNLLTLAFEMAGCQISARDGRYRGLGQRRWFGPLDPADGPSFLSMGIAASNDTNPDAFISWYLVSTEPFSEE